MKAIATLMLVLAIFAAYSVYTWHGAIPAGEDLSPYELSLVAGRCTGPELVDRRLLQQSWFHDQQFTKIAGSFGQSSFSFYNSGKLADFVEGAFCISENTIEVRYYDRKYVPIAADVSKLSVSFGTKLIQKDSDSFVVRVLTKDRMVLAVSSDGKDHVFYRRH